MKKQIHKRIDKELIFCLIALLIPTIQFAIFYIGVNFNSFSLAFKEYNVLEGKYKFEGFVNFKRVWTELVDSAILTDAFWNSIQAWIWGTLLGMTLAVFFAYYIYKQVFFSKTFKVLLFLPSVLPGILCSVMFRYCVNEAIPMLADELFGKEIVGLLVGKDTRFSTAIFYTVWFGFGSQVLIHSGSMAQVSPSVIEAGQIDGATPFVEFWNIVIPEVIPAISTFLITGVATIFTNQANLYSFFGHEVEYADYTIGYYLFKLTNQSASAQRESYPYASALGLCCTLVAVPLTFGVRKAMEKLGD